MFSLLEELLVEILPRVSSVESLLRFKCLSKWCCCFTRPKNSPKTTWNVHQRVPFLDHHKAIIISKSVKRYVINHYPVGYWFRKQSTHRVVQFGFEYPETDCDPRVVGCCNGLWCILVDDYNFVLCNPSTRKSHILPALYKKDEYDWIRIRGFGYDYTDVWVMKEYGVKESWCKVLTLPDFGQAYDLAYRVPIVICMSKEGEVLLVDEESSFLIYNPKTGSNRHRS